MTELLRRGRDVSFAFLRMGFLLEVAYPLAFVMTQLSFMMPIFTFYFVGQATQKTGPEVGYDYFTYVAIGILTLRMLAVGLTDLSSQLDEAIQQGRLETMLVEPIHWKLLPFAMAEWSFIFRLVVVTIIGVLISFMGASYRLAGVPAALALLVVGVLATLSIGVLAMSVKILAKRSDPVLAIITLASQVLSGVYYSVDVLPPPLRVAAFFLPQTYVLSGIRQVLMIDGSGVVGPSPIVCFLALAAFCAVMYTISLTVLGRSLDYARRIGVLGGY